MTKRLHKQMGPTVHFVELPDGSQVDNEPPFISHQPGLAASGINGTQMDRSEWLPDLQAAPRDNADPSSLLDHERGVAAPARAPRGL